MSNFYATYMHIIFFILEFAEGGSLYDHMYVKNYQFNLEESLQWAREIAEGMHLIYL